MTITELLEKRGKLIADMRQMLDTASAEGRDLTSDEAQRYDAMDTDQEELGNLVERHKKQAALDELMDAPVHSAAPRRRLPVTADGGVPANPLASAAYRDGFLKYCRIGNAPLDGRVLAALQIGTDSEGGYIVPEEFERALVMAMQDINEIRTYASVVTTSGDRHIPIEDTLGTAAWTAEEAAYTESDAAFGRVTLGAHKLGTIIKVSEELLQDSMFNLESYLATNFGKRFGLAEEAAFVNGDGVGKPTGIVQGSSLGITAAGIAAITADELIDLYHSLKRPYRASAVWLMNDDTVKAVRKLKDNDGQYLWQPGLQAGQPDRILNRSVVSSDAMPTLATGAKTVVFGDLSYYTIADRSGIVGQRLNELYAANGQVGFRAFRRTDGAVTLSEAVKHLIQA